MIYYIEESEKLKNIAYQKNISLLILELTVWSTFTFPPNGKVTESNNREKKQKIAESEKERSHSGRPTIRVSYY